jgi:hypothetical protein
MCLRGSAAVFLFFDLTSAETFAKLAAWLLLIAEIVNSLPKVVVVEAKADGAHARAISREQAQRFAWERCLVLTSQLLVRTTSSCRYSLLWRGRAIALGCELSSLL